MISLRDVNKSFKDIKALSDINMTIEKGSIYGLIGTNGAGKTTILKLLAGVIEADSGDLMIEDASIFDNACTKAKISFIPDDLQFFAKYNLYDAGRYMSALYDNWDYILFECIIRDFGLASRKQLGTFSKGMQKQAVFALSLATCPDYLLLDEPIDGLDPIVRKAVWRYIVDASATRGMTTLISSHNLREMEGICDHVGIIANGKMVLERDLDELRSDIHKVQISFGSDVVVSQDAYKSFNIMHMEKRGAVDILIVRNDRAALDHWNEQFKPVLFDPLTLSLEEIFIYELGGLNHDAYQIIG